MNSEIFIEGVESVYDCIDKSTTLASFFKLNYHQIIPKYYFLSRDSLRKIILSYSMGSGKSAASVFLIAHFYNEIKKQKSLVKYGLMEERNYSKQIYVIGNYATIEGLKNEIKKPEFGIVDSQLIGNINAGLKSTNPIEQQDAQKKLDKLMHKIEKHIQFINFQALFNRCFPTLKINNLIQRTDNLISAFKRGTLEYKEEVFESMRDSIIIIDEFQRMYTTQYGINTYGFVIGAIMKFANKYNIKFVFLSGTMMNTSPCELAYLNSILDEKEFINTEQYITQESFVNGTINVNVLDKSREAELIDMIKDSVIYYNQKDHAKDGSKEAKRYIKNSDIEMEIPFPRSTIDDSKLKMLVIEPTDESLPVERYIGNMMINVDGKDILNLYSIKLQDVQNYGYEKRLDEFNNINDGLDNDEDENTIREVNPRDCVADGKLRIAMVDGVYKGRILDEETLYKYSGIGYEMTKITLNAVMRNEKVIIYNDKITSFGLIQYMEILKQNGCCELGKPPTNYSRCKKCFKTFEEHKDDHPFQPITMTMISGSITTQERDKITAAFNKPNNLYGNIISIIFISSVAQTGVSFLNTNNLIILNRINTLSRLQQIYGRIVRTHSHDGLPKEKRHTNIYTFAVEGENEQKPTIDYSYYMIRGILNNYINDTMMKIKKASVTDDIFNNPVKISNGNIDKKLFREDLNNELKNVIGRIKINDNFPWEFNNLCDRIKNPNFIVSFINFSKINTQFIKNELLSSNLIRYRKYNTVNNEYSSNLLCYPYYRTSNDDTLSKDKLIFKDEELESLAIDRSIFEQYKSDIINCYKNISKNSENYSKLKNRAEIILSQVMKMTYRNVELFKDLPEFWNLIFYIGDEYYEDDDKNFFQNHSTKGRDIKKMAGMYLGDSIVLKDATKKLIDRELKTVEKIPHLKKIYGITSEDNMFTGNNWFLKVIIMDIEINKFAETKLSVNNCFSYQPDVIKEDLNLKLDLSKKNFCFDLIQTVCDYVIKNKLENKIITPFTYFDKNAY